MLTKLRSYGCNLSGNRLGAIMYADHLVLLSPSLDMIQTMLKICETELSLLDLAINATKSVCLRVGKRFDKICCGIKTNMGILPWTSEARYLGVYVVAGTKFSCNFSNCKV